jgi:hypothetical protein
VATVSQRARQGRQKVGRSMPFLLVCGAAREEVWVQGNVNADLDVQSSSIVSRGRGYGVTWR